MHIYTFKEISYLITTPAELKIILAVILINVFILQQKHIF